MLSRLLMLGALLGLATASAIPALDDATSPTVTGLSADYLDGLDSGDFARKGHHHDGRYFTEQESDARYASVSHAHDDRYYTETEASGIFAAIAHDHTSLYYTRAQSDQQFAVLEHDHDEEYYSKKRSDERFSPLGHSHDDVYFAMDVSDERYAPKGHDHNEYLSEAEADDRYQPLGGVAPFDADSLDGLDSSAFVRSGAPMKWAEVAAVFGPGADGSIATASRTWVPMSGMTLSYTSPAGPARVSFVGSMCGPYSDGSTGRGQWRLVVDGAPVAYAAEYVDHRGSTLGVVSLDRIVQLAAGDHVIRVEWRVTENAAYVHCHTNASIDDVGTRILSVVSLTT